MTIFMKNGMLVKEAIKITGSMTRTTKMPGLSIACRPGNAKQAPSCGWSLAHHAMDAMH